MLWMTKKVHDKVCRRRCAVITRLEDGERKVFAWLPGSGLEVPVDGRKDPFEILCNKEADLIRRWAEGVLSS